uniref:Uncharacterized protein n=1 Tax=Heterorhabditis bacteriophora TaxID=37862 RepID=A0A1I7WNN0_HETBA
MAFDSAFWEGIHHPVFFQQQASVNPMQDSQFNASTSLVHFLEYVKLVKERLQL